MPGIQAVSDQPWDASVKSLVAFPQLMALMGETRNGAKPGRCFSGPAAGRDGLGTAIVHRRNKLPLEVINRTESYYHNEESCTGKTDSHGTWSYHPITVLTANPVITEPATTVISIEPAILMWSIFPTANPTVVLWNPIILRIRRFICTTSRRTVC